MGGSANTTRRGHIKAAGASALPILGGDDLTSSANRARAMSTAFGRRVVYIKILT
jgi:hypothetical protein